VVIDVEILVVVGVEALDEVDTDEDVDVELDVDTRREISSLVSLKYVVSKLNSVCNEQGRSLR